MKSQHVQLLYGNGEAIRPIKGTYPHIASTPREVGVSHDHEFRSFVRLLCLTRAPPPQLEERVAVGTRISPRPPHRSRRALLTHRAPPSGQTSCDERFNHARRPTRSHYSDRRGISAQCPNRGRLTAVPLG